MPVFSGQPTQFFWKTVPGQRSVYENDVRNAFSRLVRTINTDFSGRDDAPKHSTVSLDRLMRFVHSCATERARLHRPVMYLFSPYVSLRYIDRSTAGSYSASFCRITSLQYTVKILYLLQLMHWKVFTLLFIINAFSFFFSRTHLLRRYRFSSHIWDN